MSPERVTYQNWIVDLGRDPTQAFDADEISSPGAMDSGISQTPTVIETERQRLVREAVTTALSRLRDDERELVEQYHFMGRSYQEIAELSGRTVYRLESLHKRALRKLRRALAPLVKRLYGLGVSTDLNCPICSSPYRHEIDLLIRDRERVDTWRPIMRALKNQYDITITTPQTLIGHEKYH